MPRQAHSSNIAAGLRNINAYNRNRAERRYTIKDLTDAQREILFDGATAGIPSHIVNMFLNTVEDNEKIPSRINSGYKKRDMALLFLYYLVQHSLCTFKYINATFGIPKSQIIKIFSKLNPAIVDFIQEHIKFGTFEERKECAQNHMPEPFKSYTAILDGVHILLKNVSLKNGQTVFLSGSFGSHKFGNKDAASFQVAVNAAGLCILCDDGNPAGVHDYKCLWRAKFDNKFIFNQDRVIADMGYIGKRIRISILTPIKGQVSPTQAEFNKQLSSVRVRVEHFFGIAKGRLDYLREYRGPLHMMPLFVKFGFALTNLILSSGEVTEAEKRAAYLQFTVEHNNGDDVECSVLNLEPCVYQGRVRRFEHEQNVEQTNWNDAANVATMSSSEYEAHTIEQIDRYRRVQQEQVDTTVQIMLEVQQSIAAEYQRVMNYFEAIDIPIPPPSLEQAHTNYINNIMTRKQAISQQLRANTIALEEINEQLSMLHTAPLQPTREFHIISPARDANSASRIDVNSLGSE